MATRPSTARRWGGSRGGRPEGEGAGRGGGGGGQPRRGAGRGQRGDDAPAGVVDRRGDDREARLELVDERRVASLADGLEVLVEGRSVDERARRQALEA